MPIPTHGQLFAIQFSSDGRILAISELDKKVRLWEVQTSRPIGKPLEHDTYVSGLSFSPNGQNIATLTSFLPVQQRQYVQRWNVRTGEPQGTRLLWNAQKGGREGLVEGRRIEDVSFSTDGDLLVAVTERKEVQIREGKPGLPQRAKLKHHDLVRRAKFSPDGRAIATTSKNLSRLWDTRSGKPLRDPISHPHDISFVSFSEATG